MSNIHGSEQVFIDAFDFSDAYTAWHNFPHKDKDAGKEIMQYLGIHHYQAHRDGFIMSPEAAHRLRMLLSPHVTTIIRMYYARQTER